MIKICHIVDRLNIGGLERTLLEIVMNLPAYEHQVWCLSDKGILAAEIEAKGITVREFGIRGGLNIFSLLRLAGEMKKEGFAIVHSHGLFASMWGRPAAFMAAVPKNIVHCQNIYDGISLKDVFKLRLLSHITTKIIAVSEAVKKSLVGYVGISPGKIAVIYNSSPCMRQAYSRRQAARHALGFGEHDFVVGNIGRLEEHKGHHVLLEAVARCRNENLTCRCVIAGDGPQKAYLSSKLSEYGLQGAVALLGWRKDVGNLLAAMDVFVQPSLLREGLPLALAEAASAGLALIATPVGGNAEIVNEGVNGFIVAAQDSRLLAEKIGCFIKNPQMAKTMGENSRNIWQEKFRLEKMLEKISGIYG